MTDRFTLYFSSLLLCLLLISAPAIVAQDIQNRALLGETERLIRIAEPGQLADSVNVWGSVGSPGRYLIPENMRLPELISYSFGPRSFGGSESTVDWTKVRLKIKVTRYNAQNKMTDVALFEYMFEEPEPAEMFEYDLQNNDIISLQVRRKAGFLDVITAIAPIAALLASTALIIDRVGR